MLLLGGVGGAGLGVGGLGDGCGVSGAPWDTSMLDTVGAS